MKQMEQLLHIGGGEGGKITSIACRYFSKKKRCKRKKFGAKRVIVLSLYPISNRFADFVALITIFSHTLEIF